MSIPYEYLTILLFSINYAYENRKIIKYSTLQELYNKGYLEEQIDPLSKEILNPSTTIDIEKEVVNH